MLALWNYYLAPISVQTWNKLVPQLCVCIGCCSLGNELHLWDSTATGCPRGCGVSILGDTQKMSGQVPGQLALGGPAWARGIGQDELQGAPSNLNHSVSFIYKGDGEGGRQKILLPLYLILKRIFSSQVWELDLTFVSRRSRKDRCFR